MSRISHAPRPEEDIRSRGRALAAARDRIRSGRGRLILAIVRSLKPAPAAHVVDEDSSKIRAPALDIGNQSLERVPSLDPQPAPAFVGIGSDDLQTMPIGIKPDRFGLVLRGILLMLGGHAHILRACLGSPTVAVIAPSRHLANSSREGPSPPPDPRGRAVSERPPCSAGRHCSRGGRERCCLKRARSFRAAMTVTVGAQPTPAWSPMHWPGNSEQPIGLRRL